MFRFKTCIPKPPKVGKLMAQDPYKAVILHTVGVQVGVSGLGVGISRVA